MTNPFMPMAALLAIVLLAPVGSAPAKNGDEQRAVSVIRQRYAAINKELAKYKAVKKELVGFSTEGGELTAYFEGPRLRKIVARFQGESGRALEEYYYWDDELQFVYRKDDTYTEPMSGKVASSDETRFYFEGRKLIRWLDSRGKPMRRGSAQFGEEQNKYLSNSQLFVAGARSGKTTIEAL